MTLECIFNKTIPLQPLDRDSIFFEINHDQGSILDQPRPHVGINNLRFGREDVRTIKEFIRVNGIIEGAALDFKITERGKTEIINMYIDNMNGGLNMSRDGLNVGIKMLQSLDWFDDMVDAFTFETMYNETGVTPFTVDGIKYSSYQQYFDQRCIYIPYVISIIPNFNDAFTALFGMTYIGTELFKIVNDIEAALNALFSNPFQWGEVARLIVLVAFSVLLFITLIGLITQLVATLIQPVKYHGAMLMSDMLKIVAVKIGLQESSSIWDNYPYNQIAFLPEKYNPIDAPASESYNIMGIKLGGFGTKGNQVNDVNAQNSRRSVTHDSQTSGIIKGFYNGTGGDFLRLMKQYCNGKIVLPDQTTNLVLERRDWFPQSTPYQIQRLRMDWYDYNTTELNATTEISFIDDPNEQNVANGNYVGTILQATHQPIVTIDILKVCLKNLKEINLPVSRGAAKTSLNFVENAVLDIEKLWSGASEIAITVALIIVDAIIEAANAFIALLNIIIDVIGVIVSVIDVIIDAVSFLLPGSVTKPNSFDWNPIPSIKAPDPFNFAPAPSYNFNDRLNTLLLTNDIVNIPKMVMIDVSRPEFKSKRIAYIYKDNSTVVSAQWLLNYFYCIDMFCDTPDSMNGNTLVNNRRTIIEPALNKPSDKNSGTVSLSDFKNLVYNPLMLDNFGEEAEATSIQWYPTKNGMADFIFRKKKWLNDPENANIIKRSEEINVNLLLTTTLPNGQ